MKTAVRAEAAAERKQGCAFNRQVEGFLAGPVRAVTLTTFQVNVGLKCNLACRHCHVESSPKRVEEMTWETMECVLDAASRAGVSVIDITGGAPEMHRHFRRFVGEARRRGFDVIVRTNLTILLVEGYEDLPAFFREQKVRLVASLPCYLEENVDKQRGPRVYEGSIEVIRRLNAQGYGTDPDLTLDLVYNPQGASLPPPEAVLEEGYREYLDEHFGLRFTRLIAITNMPIGRFARNLERKGDGEAYLRRLRDAFNPQTLDGLMCRHQIHISWDGSIHDCDFNYALATGMAPGAPRNIREFDAAALLAREIRTEDHCYGCTAGCGSSCGGSLAPGA